MDTRVRSIKQLGQALKGLRTGKKMSQTELAKKTGLRQGTISEIENGTGASSESVLLILAALGAGLYVKENTKESFNPEEYFNG